MFAKIATIATFATLAVAAPTASVNQCNTGPVQCCNHVGKANSDSTSQLLGLIGVVVQDVNAVVGLGCTPISVIGVDSGAKCSATPVCCEGNEANGLVNVGCSPVSL